MSGADLGLGEHAPRHHAAHFAEAGDHLDALPHAHLRHLPHQGANLLELIQELFDLVRLDAAAGGDASTTADIDDVRVLALLVGHRVDHALDAGHDLFRVLALRDHVAHAGHRAHEIAHGAHLSDLGKLLAEVVESEVALLEFLLLLESLLFADLRLDARDLFDDAHQVALAADARGHPRGADLLQPIELLADADELDGDL